MKFYGREEELRTLRDISERSRTVSQFTVVLGRRRIGKTTLMLKGAEGTKTVYLFVNRLDEGILCGRMQETAREAGIEIPGRMERFGDLLATIMIQSRTEPVTVILDEFQEFENIDPGIFRDIQRAWDLHKDGSHINLVVGGSVHSLMVRIFEDEKQPLFNRPTSKIELRPFPVSVMRRIMGDCNPAFRGEDLLVLYMLTGGVPYYIENLVDAGATDRGSMLERALSTGSVFLRDGRDLITAEFGRENKTYLSVLQLIAGGMNRRPDLEQALGTSMGEYLRRLSEEYGFIARRSPVLTHDARLTRWELSDMYLRFYYRYIQPNQGFVESGRTDLLLRTVRSDLESYEGRVLEDLVMRMVSEEWTYTEVGGYWNRKGDVEIDAVVLDDLERRATFIEVKRNPEKLDMGALASKVETVRAHVKGYDVRVAGMSMDDLMEPGRTTVLSDLKLRYDHEV